MPSMSVTYPSNGEFSFNPKAVALRLALKYLFERACFSICTIDDCLKLTGCLPKAEVYKIMRVLHCVQLWI
jgi:hypothetical protein